MPFLFWVAIIFAAVAIIAFAVATAKRASNKKKEKEVASRALRQEPRRGEQDDSSNYDFLGRRTSSSDSSITSSRPFYLTAVVLALLAIGFTFWSSATQVSTKEFGVVTSFGQPVGTLTNGLHMVAPWQKVTEIDAAIQTDNHTIDKKDCISVRIAHQATACVDASIRWRIQDGSADALFQNYRDFDNIRDSLVTRDLNAALNAVFENYDPLAVDSNGNATSPSMTSLSDKVTARIRQKIGDQINVLSVIIPVAHFDDNTQTKVNALLAQVAQTRIAQQAVETAKNQAEANKVLAASVSQDPNVLVSKCLDIVEAGKTTLPAGFSCWPGNGSAVVVPASK